LRTRVQPFKGGDDWQEITLPWQVPARETAIIVCDMWDDHWCPSASKRCAEIAKKMEPVLRALRARGVTIVHAPSDCMDFYKDLPQRKRMQQMKAETPKPLDVPEPPLPIDDSDGGCDHDKPAKMFKAWTREHPALTIHDDDFISDNGKEVYALLRQRGIKTLLVCGVHTNMCVLGRSFAIRQMTRWGVPCVLVRDLTDAMYNPKMRPHVSHEQGTELVIRHIEKYWCPTVLSEDLLGK
jgi:nicotinamidase-related amidase